MRKRGTFVVIDGPNGVGKTTIVGHVCNMLRIQGCVVLQTKEPTHRFRRENEELRGDALARLIVADREAHLRLDILPALNSGSIAISDRYVCSSLVYRRLDGIPFGETWKHNAAFCVPDLNVVLVASEAVIQTRVSKTKQATRFEREHTYSDELLLYKDAASYLREKGYTVVLQSNEGFPDEVSRRITTCIQQLLDSS